MASKGMILFCFFIAFFLIANGLAAEKATAPVPADGAVDVNEDYAIYLGWTAGDSAESHNVYLGISYSAVNNATTSSAEFIDNRGRPSYAFIDFDDDKKYYWRIDEVTSTTTIKGDVWNFKTLRPWSGCPQFLSGQKVGTVELAAVNEASGIVASRKNQDVLWVHNDSGDSARVYAMNAAGEHLGVYSLSGAGAVDWEDIAIGPGPIGGLDYLYCGDIGDNSAWRSYITVYRVVEPQVDSQQSPVNAALNNVDAIRLKYPDGSRDCETLMVDPLTRDIYLISKRETPSKVYRASYPQSTTQTTTMELVTTLPWGWAVGGEISPTGKLIIVKGGHNASVWKVENVSELWQAFAGPECLVSLISEPQGEAICFSGNGCGYFTVSEGSHQPLYYFARDIEPLSANLDYDCDVDMRDYALFASEYTDLPNDSFADLDGNGYVEIADLAILANKWLEGVEH